MFSFISKIFKGIINFFTGLLGGKQAEGKFYKQLDESPEPAPQKPSPEPQPAQATKTPQSKPDNQPAPQATQPQPQPKSKPTSQANQPQPKPQPVAASNAQNGKVENESRSDQTFAPDYLIPVSTQSRRRPGPSLDMFRDIARQVKTPSA